MTVVTLYLLTDVQLLNADMGDVQEPMRGVDTCVYVTQVSREIGVITVAMVT